MCLLHVGQALCIHYPWSTQRPCMVGFIIPIYGWVNRGCQRRICTLGCLIPKPIFFFHHTTWPGFWKTCIHSPSQTMMVEWADKTFLIKKTKLVVCIVRVRNFQFHILCLWGLSWVSSGWEGGGPRGPVRGNQSSNSSHLGCLLCAMCCAQSLTPTAAFNPHGNSIFAVILRTILQMRKRRHKES